MTTHHSETDVQNAIRIRASQLGWRLWRSNVGVLPDRNGRPVRFGLANDSKAQHEQFASADLIGIAPVLIGPEHVGRVLGLFVSVEAKAGAAEVRRAPAAQGRWRDLVTSMGGKALLTCDPEDVI